ncbi:hypothetical protein D3C86_1347850 [compost metagenome]
MPAERVDGQALAQGSAQKAQVARAEDEVIGVVHHGDLAVVFQVVLDGIETDLIHHLGNAAAVMPDPPHRNQLLGDVAVEIALQGAFEEGGEAGAVVDRVACRGDQAAPVDQIRGEGDIGGGEAERCTDQHGHLLVGKLFLGALEVEEHRIIEVDVALFLEIAGQLGQHRFVEGGAVVDALDPGLHQAVEVAGRGIEVDRWIEQQHTFEVEAASGFVELTDECCLQGAQAVAGQVEGTDLQAWVLGAHGLHRPI